MSEGSYLKGIYVTNNLSARLYSVREAGWGGRGGVVLVVGGVGGGGGSRGLNNSTVTI